MEDWSAYCLAHLFTFQSFHNSVLGLAYVSSPLPYTLGGICSAATSRSRSPFSVNTGLSSYKSASVRQGRLLQREAELVTAHEFGHNWGSEHDPMKPECTPPSAQGGNFIMYSFSNQGYDKNNYVCIISSLCFQIDLFFINCLVFRTFRLVVSTRLVKCSKPSRNVSRVSQFEIYWFNFYSVF